MSAALPVSSCAGLNRASKPCVGGIITEDAPLDTRLEAGHDGRQRIALGPNLVTSLTMTLLLASARIQLGS